jgi:4,5-dihydroxyphthalate decarboxylase
MAKLQLSLAITSNPRTWPIVDGRVKADGIAFTKTVLGPAEMFWRQLRFAEFGNVDVGAVDDPQPGR